MNRRERVAAGVGISLLLSVGNARVALPAVFARPQQPDLQTLSIPPTSELPRLLDLVALRLKVQIEYDPANPQLKGQQVTLRSAQPGATPQPGTGGGTVMTDAELWAATSRLLVQRGLTTVRAPGATALSVVKIEDAPRLARLEPIISADQPASDAAAEIPAGFRNQPVRLRHVSLKEATDALRIVQRNGPGGGAGSGGAGGPAAAGGTSGELLLLSDTTPRIDEQLAILRHVDTADNATVVQIVPVSNVTPVQLAAAVTQLATKREAVSGEKLPGEVLPAGSAGIAAETAAGGAGRAIGGVMVVAPRRAIEKWKTLITLADQREPVTTQTYTPKLFAVKEVASLVQQIAGAAVASGATPDDRFKVVVEEPTGSLIITATPSQHEKVAALMERLDAVPGEARRPVRSFVVKNRPVNEFVATLQRLISAGVLEGSSDPSSSQVAGSGPPPLGNNVPLTPGVTTMVPTLQQPTPTPTPVPVTQRQAPASGQAKSLAITLTADEPTNTIIAVGDGRLLDQLDALIKTLDVRQAQVMLEAYMVAFSDSDQSSLGVELDQLNVADGTRIRLASLFGLPSVAGTLGGNAARGGNALILSPGDFSVVIQAMQTLKNGRTLSLPKMLVSNNQRASLNSVNQAPYAASFTAGNASTPTTSYGGSSDAGTQVTVRPQIGDGGSLLLDYNISISAFTADPASTNLPPPRSVTSVQSLATIPDGYTVVVGGMQTQSEGSEINQVPLLGSIPGIGELFKTRTQSKSMQRFIVFIKATVMRDQSLESLRYVSDLDANAARLPSSWPHSEPQVVR